MSSQSTLVLLPSLSLLSQTLREWTFASHSPFHVLCVCSDETVGRKAGPLGSGGAIPKVVIDLPQTVDVSFADSLRTYLVEKTTSSWHFWFGLLEEFVKEEGHARVHSLYGTENGYGLGSWVNRQRSRRERLSLEQKSSLESLDGWIWDARKAMWEEGLSYLTMFVEAEGHAKVAALYKTEDWYRLGQWVGWQRRNRDNSTPERESRLETLGFIWKVK